MGSKIGVNAVVTNNNVLVTHSGNSKRFSIQYNNDGRIPSMGISKITTRNCHVSSNNLTKQDGEIRYNSIIDINSHADTHYFGKNFLIVSSTEQLFSVAVLLDKLVTTNNVAIITASTAMIDHDGAVSIAVLVKGLDFTDKMDKGLINPNQCRSFGVQCFNNPTDTTRKLVFYANNVFLLLCMQGTYFLEEYLCPSDDELGNSTWVIISDESRWDPYNVTYLTIWDMSEKMKKGDDPVGSRSTHTLSISN